MLITALIGWFAAQVLKMILVWDKKKFDFKRIIGSGGMPSSHSSFVMALTMSIGFTQESVLNADFSKTEKRLKELLGHTPIEVFAGAILGVIIAIIRYV